jgi:hypothetical protein
MMNPASVKAMTTPSETKLNSRIPDVNGKLRSRTARPDRMKSATDRL